MFKSTKNKLVAVLEELTGDNQPLVKVYGYFEPSPQQYPVAMVFVYDGNAETRLDSHSNWLTAVFVIKVQLRVKNSETVENQRLDLIDSVLDKLRSASNIDTLGGTVEKFDVLNILPFDTEADQPLIGFDVVVSASKLVSIS